MSEGPNLEAEIAQLSAAIEQKRAQLERERGGKVENQEVLHHVVSEKVYGTQNTNPKTQSSTKTQTSSTQSYLDDLDPADIARVNALVDLIPKLGLAKTIEKAKQEPAHILDAFHDALVDKLHQELKAQGLI